MWVITGRPIAAERGTHCLVLEFKYDVMNKDTARATANVYIPDDVLCDDLGICTYLELKTNTSSTLDHSLTSNTSLHQET